MESSTQAGAAPPRTTGAAADDTAASTRSLLRFGMIAGPFYLVLGLAQALVREGFDLARHPLSVLANGPGGWVQTANFVLTGAMVIAAAIGLRRALAPKSRALSGFLAAFGVSMLVAAIFPADPVDGFPPGTPLGPPTTFSTSGLIHFLAGTLGFVSLAVSCFLTGRALTRHGVPSLARLSLFSGLAVLLGFFGGAAFATAIGGVLGIWFSVVVGWAWLAVVSSRLRQRLPARGG